MVERMNSFYPPLDGNGIEKEEEKYHRLPMVYPAPAYLTLYPPSPPKYQDNSQDDKRKSMLLDEHYIRTTHIIPGAYPRCTPYVALPGLGLEDAEIEGQRDYCRNDDKNENISAEVRSRDREKEKRRERAAREARYIVGLHTSYKDAIARGGSFDPEDCSDIEDSRRRVLWNVLHRYVRRCSQDEKGKGTRMGKRRGITLFLTHANGFSKELWEPFLAHLISHSSSASENESEDGMQVEIDEIWSMDASQHGESALLNEGKLGCLQDWIDHTRDILNFLVYYLPESSGVEKQLIPPIHLPRLPDEIFQSRLSSGFAVREIVAIGHSFGGCAVTYAAQSLSCLFSSLILVDPVIRKTWMNEEVLWWVMHAMGRRDRWGSREEARAHLSGSPLFKRWDRDVFDAYIEHGIVSPPGETEEEEGPVSLKTPKLQEASVFAETYLPMLVYSLLPHLDERIRIRWVMSGRPGENETTGGYEATRELVWRRSRNCSNVRIGKAGHLIVQEAPRELAEDVYVYLRGCENRTDGLGYRSPRARL